MTQAAWTTDAVIKFIAERLSDKLAKRPAIDPEKRMQYLSAGAVLAAFDPAHLKPLDGEWVEGECEAVLADDMVDVPGARQRLSTLRPESRAAGLKHLATREAMWRARQLNQGPEVLVKSDLRQSLDRVFERVIRESALGPQLVNLLESARIRASEKLTAGVSNAAALMRELLAEFGPALTNLAGPHQIRNLQQVLRVEIPEDPPLAEVVEAVRAGISQPAGTPADLQAAIDWILTRPAPELGLLTEPQLVALLQAVRWFGEHIPGLPDIATLQRTLVRRRLTGRFERLAAGFFGRLTELKELREYVGVLEPASTRDALTRGIRSFFVGDEVAAPLMLHGMGGIGKSSLLAKFILEHLSSELPFPFVYLDFDNRFLDVEDVSTLVGEALTQLEAQYPEGTQIWTNFRPNLAAYSEALALSETPDSQNRGSLTAAGSAASIGTQTDVEKNLAEAFASDLRVGIRSNLFNASTAESSLPFVLVLDTFEEVQKRSEKAERLWRFLSHLQINFPRLRLIVSGRAPIPNLIINGRTARNMPLPPFDAAAGTSILTRMGVDDPQTAAAIYKQVGGNPLSLRLAAQVYRQGGAGGNGIEGLKTSSFLFLSASQSVIQGQLYRRILEHIPDPEVRKLAHPGLVVRRITPEVILRVLNEPCRLEVNDLDAAIDLFGRLKSQVDLVTEEPDGSLLHRADVRAIMLGMLQQTRPDQVKAIHAAAVQYYHAQTETIARGEELYHLLQLDSDRATLDAVWNPDAGWLVMSSKDELPPRAQAYLALKTNTDLDPSIRAAANQEEWELLTENKVRELIRLGGLSTARSMLQERKERRPGSALYPLEATILTLEKDFEGAEDLLTRGIDSVADPDRVDALLEMVRVRADLYAQTGRKVPAAEQYARAERIASDLGKNMLQLQIALQRLKIEKEVGPTAPQQAGARTYLKQILDKVTDAELLAARGQFTGVFLMFGLDHPELLERGLKVFSLDGIDPDRMEDFPETSIVTLDATEEGRALAREAAAELWAPTAETPHAESPTILQDVTTEPMPWEALIVQAASQGRLNEFAGRMLAVAPEDKLLLVWISDLLEEAIAPRNPRTNPRKKKRAKQTPARHAPERMK